jgi:hypothetical protein
VKRAFAALCRYIAADDPRVATANLVAMVLAWNTPFYPFYVLGASGSGMRPGAWLTLCVFPLFLSVPAVTRRYPLVGRAFLAVIGTANTVFCTWVLGGASGTQLFLLPCITLAALLFRRRERVALFGFLLLPILCGVALDKHLPVSPFVCSGEACAAIVWLNAVSVAVLTAFLGVLATGAADLPTRRPETRPP